MTDTQAPEPGAFVASLKRNNKQIRADRAESIEEDAHMAYRRQVEDLERDITRLKRTQDNMLDMSPENAQSLMLGKDFDATSFIAQDAKLGLDIRNKTIELEIAQQRFTHLFGEM